MRTDLIRRVQRLEVAPGGADRAEVERAAAIVHACTMARCYPSKATAADRELAAATTHAEEMGALLIGIRASGGLAALVKHSLTLPTPEPPEFDPPIMTVALWRAMESGAAGNC